MWYRNEGQKKHWLELMVSCGVRGDELHMSEPRWAAINRDEARLTATNRDQATRARTPYVEFRFAIFDFGFEGPIVHRSKRRERRSCKLNRARRIVGLVKVTE